MILLSSIINACPDPNLGREVALEYLETQKQFPAQVYLPTRPQADFIKAIGTLAPKKRIFLMTSGNGAGKTTVVNNIVNNLVWPKCNLHENVLDIQTGEIFKGFFDYEFYNNYPDNWPKVIWYVSNADSLDSIYEEFKVWAKPGDYKPGSVTSGHTWPKRITFNSSQWKIFYKTIDQDPKTFESANVGIIIFDEPPPQSLFRAAASRLRSGGIMIIPATPLIDAAWFLDEIINKVEVDKDKFHQKVSVWTNCEEKAGTWDCGSWGIQPKGNLTEANIRFTLSTYDPDELPAREHGEFLFLQGVVYKTYKPKDNNLQPYHFRKLDLDITKAFQYLYRMIIDPHDRRPPAVIWMRYDRWGRRQVIREWPSIYDNCYRNLPFHKIKNADPYTVEDFVKMWIEIEDLLGIDQRRMKTSIMDPNYGRKPNLVTGKMLFEEYQAEFGKQKRPRFFRTDAIDDIATGHKAVKQLLKPMVGGDLPLVIDESCYNCDYSLRNYQHKEWEGKIARDKEIREEVKEIGKDFADLIRYDAVTPISWEAPDKINMDPYERPDYNEIATQFRKRVSKIVQRPKEAV